MNAYRSGTGQCCVMLQAATMQAKLWIVWTLPTFFCIIFIFFCVVCTVVRNKRYYYYYYYYYYLQRVQQTQAPADIIRQPSSIKRTLELFRNQWTLRKLPDRNTIRRSSSIAENKFYDFKETLYYIRLTNNWRLQSTDKSDNNINYYRSHQSVS